MSGYGSTDFCREFPVSRETLANLKTYEALLGKWQRAINLVAAGTLPDFWRRHVLDSAQLAAHAPSEARLWLDIGSGAGFPGLVLAILLAQGSAPRIHLVESDRRKCAFLQTVARETAAPVQIHPERIEELTPFAADVITARALAPLGRIFEYAVPFIGAETVLLLLKGRDVERELTDARAGWRFDATALPSRSDPSGRVLIIRGLTRV